MVTIWGPRVIAAQEILLELVYPLYVTIGGSLNLSLGVLEGHFVRVEPLKVIVMSAWLPLLSACNL